MKKAVLNIDLIWPIGSYYETSNKDFNPNFYWGGEWKLDNDGTTLVAKSNESDSKFNVELGTVVGFEEHKLTMDQMPKHRPTYDGFPDGNTDGWSEPNTRIVYKTTQANPYPYMTRGFHELGGDQPHNNVQPSKIVNRWHRIG